MREFVVICLAGAAGTGARFLVSGAATRIGGAGFPFGTLAVNLLGCLVVGVLMEAALESALVPRALRTALAVGFLGAFTTFSTFGYETFRLLEGGRWGAAITNVLANLVVGLLAVGVGVVLGRLMLGGR